MKRKIALRNVFTWKGKEIMSDIPFHVMTIIMKLVDSFWKYSDKNFENLDLKQGQTVIDYGCGPARYIKNASLAVGDTGKVIAVDIHPLAIKKVNKKVKKYKLLNVKAVLGDGYHIPIASDTADVIYALEVFHMIERPKEFLLELSRLLKLDGLIIIEDGHQSRSETIHKIKESKVLSITQENKCHVRCKKIVKYHH